MKIKIVLDSPFNGINSGWPLRYINIVKELYKADDIYIFAPGDPYGLHSLFPNAFVQCDLSKTNHAIKYNKLKLVKSIIYPTRTNIHLPTYKYFPSLAKIVQLDQQHYDMAIYFGLSAYIGYHKQDAKFTICDLCDSRTRGIDNLIKSNSSYIQRIKLSIEKLYIKRIKKAYFDHDTIISAITEEDGRFIKKCLKHNSIVVVPNGVETDVNHELTKEDKIKKHKAKVLIFVGSLDYYPNIESIEYSVDNILPAIWERFHDVEFHIVGRNPAEKIKKLIDADQRMKLFANVEDVKTYLKSGTLFLGPIFSGAGMKNKFLESASCGTPVITNDEGTKGISIKNKLNGFICNSKTDIIKSIIDILLMNSDSYSALVDHSINLTKEYTWAKSANKMLESVKK